MNLRGGIPNVSFCLHELSSVIIASIDLIVLGSVDLCFLDTLSSPSSRGSNSSLLLLLLLLLADMSSRGDKWKGTVSRCLKARVSE